MSDGSDQASPHDFQLLGLEYGAAPDQVKKAYKSFVKAWHPDRFPQGSRQQLRAEEKLKDVNAAYRRIRNTWSANAFEAGRGSAKASAHAGHPRQPGDSSTAEGRSTEPVSSLKGANGPFHRLVQSLFRVRPERKRRAIRPWMLVFVMGLFVFVLLKPEPPYLPEKRPQPSPVRTADPFSAVRSTPSPAGEPEKTAPSAPSKLALMTPSQSRQEDIVAPEIDNATADRPFFTIGSGKAEVFRIQGKPSKVYGQKWVYGLSDVTFREGRVWRYHNFDGTLRVGMLTRAPAVSGGDAEFFSLGSTKDEVVRAQGTPTLVEGNKWAYGFSEVHFKGGKVIGFNNFFNNLKVAMRPSTDSGAALTRGYFTVGSSQDEVLAIQGTPTMVQGNLWSYHLSDVLFAEGKVRSVNDFSGVLRYLP